MAVLKSVPDQLRTEWGAFSSKGGFSTRFLLNAGVIPLSRKMAECMLGFRRWSGFRIEGESGKPEIGYGRGDPSRQHGMTEGEAFAEWLAHAKGRQRALVPQLPAVELPQTAFDALVSLYVDTGKWRTLEAEEGVYDVRHAVERGDWRMLADMLARGKANPRLRQAESRAVQLGNYEIRKTRAAIRAEGLQNIRRMHMAGMFGSQFEKGQAEFVYYRETGGFLPGMGQARERRIQKEAAP